MDLLRKLTNKPKSRQTLCAELGCTDRTLRREVRRLRMEGFPICSNSQKGGYWLAEGEDLKHLIHDLEHRGLSCLEAARKIRQRELKGQVKFDV